jgi:putative copper export protein
MLMAAGFPAALSARGEGGTVAFAAMVEAFSPVALAGAGTAGLTGIINALFHLRAPAELWGTRYGQFLLIKLALLAVVAAIGFHNWRRIRPTLGDEAGAQRLSRTARGELVAGALALLVTAILVALPTPG